MSTVMIDLWFIRLMSRWPLQVRALESSGEENRLGRGSNLGQAVKNKIPDSAGG